MLIAKVILQIKVLLYIFQFSYSKRILGRSTTNDTHTHTYTHTHRWITYRNQQATVYSGHILSSGLGKI